MKTKLLKTKSENVNGLLITTHVYVTKSVARHEKNKSLSLAVGYQELDEKCAGGCPTADSGGYYMCVTGNCVYFPYP